jgi:Zinc carboxypeptidase
LAGRLTRWAAPVFALAAVSLTSAGTAAAEIGPPWCGDPQPDAAGNLPDGTNPTDSVGSFPHIPYYGIKCTLDDIESQSLEGRMSIERIGASALGRPMYLVTINALATVRQRQDFQTWKEIRRLALTDPARAQEILAAAGDDVKVPVFVQGAIHGNEYEGVDADMQLIERLATTPYGEDPEVDAILDHVIVLFNIDQNPDGRIAGTRVNGNGFDLNRDFLTQSQPETLASVSQIQKWLPPDLLDQHGYVNPTLVEATTKPHNPGIDYDLWLKWNQARTLANKNAMAAIGMGVQRPINDWCSDGDLPPSSGICPGGGPPGPAVAEGWDDWGPFYTPMYSQLVGLNGSTVEMCSSTGTSCGAPGATVFPRGRVASRTVQYTVAWSTLQFDLAHRNELIHDQLEIYRRGVAGEPRPPCCDPPFDVENNWMHEYPTAYVIPLGPGQRSDAEANRLVEWLLRNGVEVSELKQQTSFGEQTFDTGSYVVWMAQPHRGLAETALSIGDDVSSRITILYAPPAAWSHGYLWGADVVTIPRDAAFSAQTNRILKPNYLIVGGVEPGKADRYALELDSATSVRTLNSLLAGGMPTSLTTASFTDPGGNMIPAGSAIFSADPATMTALDSVGKANGLRFHRVVASALPALDPVEQSPRIAVLTGAVNQDVWSLRNLGFQADPVSTGTINSSTSDPLVDYAVVFNTGAWPSAANPTARARLTAFFAAGGGYVGVGTNGAANFLTSAGQVTGLTAASRGGNGRSGIVYWENTGGPDSMVAGGYPAQDTMTVDPPTWFTAVPGSLSIDARLPLSGFFAAGLWAPNVQSASAPGSALVAHGLNSSGNARLTVFANNPLYRADPEREWPMIGAAALWADQ